MLFIPSAGDEEENEDDYQTLLRLGENEDIEEALHRLT
jgi:hypothetical protein